jgi:putative ABC transport system permease protein
MNPSRSLRLVHWLAWRPLTRDAARSLVTILGVALGVAVALAISLANEGVLTAFRNSLDHVAGRTQLEVSAGEPGLDEALLPAIAGTPGVASAAPVLQTVLSVPGEGAGTLLVLGVDVLSDAAFRDYRGPTPDLAEPLRLLTDPDAILLSERYARAHGIAVGGTLRLTTPTGVKAFTVRGVLADDGVARAMDGHIAVLDIASAQVHFGKLGQLDRVDVLLQPGAALEQAAARLRDRLPAGTDVERPEARNAQVERMLGSFQLNLFVLSLIALFVGAFLVYNTMAVSVVQQRRQIGILRSLGMSRTGILLAVVGEGVAIGLLGSLLGAALGVLLAQRTLQAVSLTVSSLYAFIVPEPLSLPPVAIFRAILSGLGVTLVASLAPALDATRVPPREDLAPVAMERRYRPSRLAAVGAFFLVLTLGLTQLGPVGGRPLFGYAAALTLLLGAILLCPLLLRTLQRSLQATLRGSRLVAVRLAVGNLGRALRRNSVTVAAMAVALSMLVSVSTMIASFRQTVTVWIDQTIRADLYVSRTGRLIKGADARLPVDLLPRIRAVPGVMDADAFRTLRLRDGQGGQFIVGAGDFDVMARRGRLPFRRGDSGRILQEAQVQDEVIVSETFAERYRLAEGDEVRLRPPGGEARFRIAGVYYDYTTDGGLVVMDRRLFQRLWSDAWLNSIVIYLAPGADAATVREAVRTVTGREDLVILSSRDLRRRVLDIFDQTFAITYALQAISLIVASLGVLTALGASVLERMREIGILRSLGVNRVGIARTVLAEAGLLGLVANVVGALAGLALSLILIHVINKQSFGWTIQFVFPGRLILDYAALTVGASVLAGLLPAWRACRVPIAEAVRYE